MTEESETDRMKRLVRGSWKFKAGDTFTVTDAHRWVCASFRGHTEHPTTKRVSQVLADMSEKGEITKLSSGSHWVKVSNTKAVLAMKWRTLTNEQVGIPPSWVTGNVL
jgi:hypothetical protein